MTRKKILVVFYLFIAILLVWKCVRADEVLLVNGDRITGDIVKEDEDGTDLRTAAMGMVRVRKSFISKVERVGAAASDTGPVDKKTEIVWKRELEAGYNASRGNTETGEVTGGFLLNRNRKHVDEITLKGNMYYSEADKKMDAEKWYTMARYAFSFGSQKKWYNFYRIETDHDRFADIDYRVLPATGVGYWFFDLGSLKLFAEAGIGWEHTSYRDKDKDFDEAVLSSRAYFEKTLFGNTKISEDFYFFPAFRDFDLYRFRSETAVTSAINSRFSVRFSLVDEYNSEPESDDIEKNDLRLTSSLVASF